MALNDENARAVSRLAHDRVVSLLNHFHADGATFDNFQAGSAVYLEQVKMDLVALASCIENRLSDLYGVDREDHAES